MPLQIVAISLRELERSRPRGMVGVVVGRRPESTGRSDPPGRAVVQQLGDPDEQAQAHRRLGYRAAYCPGVDLKDETRIHDIERAFARHDVVIAEVGRWVNLLDADPAKRAANLRTVTDGLRLAEAVAHAAASISPARSTPRSGSARTRGT